MLEFAQTAVIGSKIVEQVQDLNIKSVEERIENALIKVATLCLPNMASLPLFNLSIVIRALTSSSLKILKKLG